MQESSVRNTCSTFHSFVSIWATNECDLFFLVYFHYSYWEHSQDGSCVLLICFHFSLSFRFPLPFLFFYKLVSTSWLYNTTICPKLLFPSLVCTLFSKELCAVHARMSYTKKKKVWVLSALLNTEQSLFLGHVSRLN